MICMFKTLGYFLSETFHSLTHHKFMAVASVLTVTLSMFILGTFLAVVLNMNHMASFLESQVEMSVYLRDGLTTDQVMGVGRRLRQLPDLSDLSFTNQDEAMAEFRERLGDQAGILDAVNGNPLPASYQLSFSNPDALKEAASEVARYDEVESVQYGQDIIEQIYKVSQAIRVSGIVLIVFLACAELFIISNTIRLTVFARRREIQIMKYVGATNGFIRWPFLFEGMFIGIVGAGIASAFLWQLYSLMLDEAARAGLLFIPFIGVYPFMLHITLFLLCAGLIIGTIGSAISIRKYMKV